MHDMAHARAHTQFSSHFDQSVHPSLNGSMELEKLEFRMVDGFRIS